MREDRADILVLGCMSMGFLGLTDDLQKRIEIPVVNPVTAALKAVTKDIARVLTELRAREIADAEALAEAEAEAGSSADPAQAGDNDVSGDGNAEEESGV